jgi:uncharacterized protein YceK
MYKKVVVPLCLLAAGLLLSGCATPVLLAAGAGAAGYAGFEYEWRSCVARADGHWVSRHWARRHPMLARCRR